MKIRISVLLSLLIFLKAIAQDKASATKDTIGDKVFNEQLSPIVLSGVTDVLSSARKVLASNTLKPVKIRLYGGSYDLPQLLTQTPSVYATQGGGGIGDSYFYLRGFSQRNIAVLLNGVPVNDMETGWVYWSNWNHLLQITSAVQVQPGLGASKLALPSVGGTINILTLTPGKVPNTQMNYQYLSSGMHWESVTAQTGRLKNGLSALVRLGHLHGKGYIDMTSLQAYDYYVSLLYEMNDKHRFMLFLTGAPQWHYQRNKAPKLADYINNGKGVTPSIKYNSEWGYLKGEKFSWSKNFFHKPLLSLNWDWQIDSATQFSSVLYGAWGRGGGTGPIGAINGHYAGDPLFTGGDGQVRFDDIYTWNSGGHVADFGDDRTPDAQGKYINNIGEGLTRYAFMNNHAWYGAVFNLSKKLSHQWKINTGLDLRTTTGNNTLTVNDVLGADGYLVLTDLNHSPYLINPTDFVEATYDWNPFKSIDNLKKIAFYEQSKIKWLAGYAQIKLEKELFKTFLQGSLSNQFYQKTDYFHLPEGEQTSGWLSKTGGNIKAGAGYRIRKKDFVYINAGYYSKQPLFKAVFSKFASVEPGKNLKNEKIYGIEAGYDYRFKRGKIHVNAYYTSWSNHSKQINDYYQNQFLHGIWKGIEEIHKGLEVTANLKFLKILRIENILSVGDWYYNSDQKNVVLYNDQHQPVVSQNYHLKAAKVENAAQFTNRLTLSYRQKQLEMFVSQLYIDKLYAKINAGNLLENQYKGSLQLPAYSLIEAGFTYKIKWNNTAKIRLKILVNNLFNKHYIAESKTSYFPGDLQNRQTWKGINTENLVYFGWGRTWNFNINVEL